MSDKLKSIRGMHDGLPHDVAGWRHIEEAARTICSRYGFREIRLPILEPTPLFIRSIGSETDIVDKEMYTFEDKGGDWLSLRPEGTAGAVRAYLQAGLTRSGIQRWFYMGPMFRRERPQKGRLRQFQQIGVELFGDAGPVCDAEILAMAHDLLERIGIRDVRLELNSLGCPACRPAYREELLAFLHRQHDHLCDTCRTRIDRNPMRVLDCKEPGCQAVLGDAPEMLSHLCDECDAHFHGLKENLDRLAVPYHINPRIVRGLDYYTRTAFEIVTTQLGAQGTVIAGGRYDGLVEELGGPTTPAIGFALGLERLALLLPDADPETPDVALVALGEEAQAQAVRTAHTMRAAGLATVLCGSGSAKSQFKRADREQARFVVVIGEDELARDELTLKDMRDGTQQSVSLDQAVRACREAASG
ncbi:MAG TPA: histidine--tRNA ligase [Mariprofundaceae bacterium]|nr:histidine--tRNA ligase [Mariprofundaceae bacterium]